MVFEQMCFQDHDGLQLSLAVVSVSASKAYSVTYIKDIVSNLNRYLDLNHKRKLAEFLPENVEKEMLLSTTNTSEQASSEPPTKKAKFKGR